MSYCADSSSRLTSHLGDLYGLRRPHRPSFMPPFFDFSSWDECFGYVDEYGEWQHTVKMRPPIRPMRRRPVRRPLIARFKRGVLLRLHRTPEEPREQLETHSKVRDTESDDEECITIRVSAISFAASVDLDKYYRNLAKKEIKKCRAAMSASRKATREGQHALAQEKRSAGVKHLQQADVHNKTAAQIIFEKKNARYGADKEKLRKVDLHGLHVVEAEMFVEKHICNCKLADVRSTIIVTGKGLHSEGGQSRLKPAILALLEGIPDISACVNQRNEGQVVVRIERL